MKAPLLAVFALLLPGLVQAEDGQLQFAALGDFKLESGEVLRECRVGYRTFGRLDAQRANAVLVPTWFGGTSAELETTLAPGGLVDSAHYFGVAVDALGNGVSTSPSNSRRQPRMRFPKIGIGDMVRSQHQLLTQVLHLEHLRAVVGFSMGGMQAFEWAVTYPDFVDKIVPIVGSPRVAAYDLVRWQAEIDAVQDDAGWKHGNYKEQPARRLLFALGQLSLTTPEGFNASTKREAALASLAQGAQALHFDANDRIRQTQAMMALDVGAAFGGSLEAAAAAVKAKVLVIVSTSDHLVTPGPAVEFAKLLGTEALQLHSDCGHLLPSCEAAQVASAVKAFLAE